MAGSPYSGRMLNQQIDYAYKAPARIQAEEAIPSRHELFILGDGEKKVEMKVDTRKFRVLVSGLTIFEPC